MDSCIDWTVKQKKDALELALDYGQVFIAVLTNVEGVKVPEHKIHAGSGIGLNLNWKFKTPMEINDWGVKATLSFDGQPYDCEIPWKAIIAMTQRGHALPKPKFKLHAVN